MTVKLTVGLELISWTIKCFKNPEMMMHKMIQKITKTVVTIFAGISLSFVGLKQEI